MEYFKHKVVGSCRPHIQLVSTSIQFLMIFPTGRTTKWSWNIFGKNFKPSTRSGEELPRLCMSWTTLLRMELQELFRISRMTSTKLDSSKTSNLKRLMESNRELNSEIKQRDLLILSMNQENFNMRENLPNRQERSLWVSNLQVACLMKVKITKAEEVLQNLLLHLLEIETVNMVVLVAKILRDLDTIILSNLETRESMIHTQRQRVSQPILQLSRKRKRRILQSMIVAQNPVTLMQTVMIQKFREKRRRSKRRRQRRRL